MKRERKFRAWQDNQVLHQAGLGNYAISRFVGFIDNDSPLMEFTGVTDYNGIEIYEGDIIQTYCYNKIQKHEVILSRLGWTAGGYHLDDIYFVGSGINFKVIGNIHQEPELLKQESNG